MKYLKIILACLITLILINVNEAKSCNTTDVQMTIGSCTYTVTLCVDCTIGPAPSTVAVYGFRLTNPNCTPNLTALQVLTQIESIVMTYDYIYTYLCDPLQNVPPCSTGTIQWQMNHFVCWQMEWVSYSGQLYLVYHPCENDYDDYCYEVCDFCWIPTPPPNGSITKTCGTPTMEGSVYCTKEGYEVSVPPKQAGNKSECYIYHTPCNP